MRINNGSSRDTPGDKTTTRSSRELITNSRGSHSCHIVQIRVKVKIEWARQADSWKPGDPGEIRDERIPRNERTRIWEGRIKRAYAVEGPLFLGKRETGQGREESDEAGRCVRMCAQEGTSERHGYRQVSALPCRDNTDTMGDNIIHAGESYKRNPRRVTR